MVAPQSEQNLQQISAHFHEALRLNTFEQNNESKVCLYILVDVVPVNCLNKRSLF